MHMQLLHIIDIAGGQELLNDLRAIEELSNVPYKRPVCEFKEVVCSMKSMHLHPDFQGLMARPSAAALVVCAPGEPTVGAAYTVGATDETSRREHAQLDARCAEQVKHARHVLYMVFCTVGVLYTSIFSPTHSTKRVTRIIQTPITATLPLPYLQFIQVLSFFTVYLFLPYRVRL